MSEIKFQTNSLNSGDFENIFDFTNSHEPCLGIPYASLLDDNTAVISIAFLDSPQEIKAAIDGDGVILGTRLGKTLDFKFHLKSGSGKIFLTNNKENYYMFWGFKQNGIHIINKYESIFIDFSKGVDVIDKPNYHTFLKLQAPPSVSFFTDWVDS
jgi:hypothetical protein